MTAEKKAEEGAAPAEAKKVQRFGYRVTVDVLFPIDPNEAGGAAAAEKAAHGFLGGVRSGDAIPGGAIVSEKIDIGSARVPEK